jgi:pimeloyl-ACP methyl ester carboxylesterase
MTRALLYLILAATLGADGADVRSEDVEFTSRGVRLSGTLVLPAGDVRAAVVFVHGSGRQIRNLVWAERFARDGIAALVYDKRGAGRSGGTYESEQSVGERNLALLADDAAAALDVLSKHPALQGVPVGLTGISQAGWIVPLAAERSRAVRFVVLWSGPVCKVSEEDIYSKYTGDKDGTRVPSYDEALRARTQPYVWPDFLGKDTDPRDSLAALRIPGLWIFGGKDGSVPVDLSIRRLQGLRTEGHAYDHVLVPDVGHDNMAETFANATAWITRAATR